MIYAIFSVSMLTIFIGFIAVRTRIACVRNKTISPGYFKLMQGDKLPENLIKTGRCYNNMFEVPCLFYVVSTLYLVLEIESSAALVFAWLFVILRSAQAYVHLTSNKVKYRMYLYGAGILSVFVLWVNLLIEHL